MSQVSHGFSCSCTAKNRTGNTGDAATTRGGLPPQSRHTDLPSTPTSLGATSGRHHATDATSRHGSGDLVSARRHGSGDVASTSSTPTATSSRRQGTTSQGESGSDLVSVSPAADATSSRCQGIDTTSRRDESGDLVSEKTRHVSGDVASTSSGTPDATNSRRQAADTTKSGDLVSARNRVSEQVALIEQRGHDQTAANQEGFGNPEGRSRARDAGVSVHFAIGNEDAELQDDKEKRMKRQAESTDASRKKHSGDATVQPEYHHRQQELKPAAAPAVQSAAPIVSRKEEDDAAGARGKALSQELQAQNLGPLRQKILKTVDDLKGDLSELFSKSPELNPTPRARPPRLPKQQATRAVSSRLPAARARHAAAAGDVHRGSAVKAGPRGLPSRRYRQCRAADSWSHSMSCHHGCCGHHGKPECSSCRGYCCRPRTHEPSAPRNNKPPAAKEKRRPPPRNHCRPVLKGAPFIICSSCFTLVQVPADFAVATKTVRKLRCGSCSTVLSYSYRDPGRRKKDDQLSTDGGSEMHHTEPDPFAPFVDGFGLSSYSTEDEQPLHVSRNSSFGTIDGARGVGRLHRLMGYGSATELLRHSPDLYESFSERTTPDVGHCYDDRKGKGVCVDEDDDHDVDDSDEEDDGVLRRSAARGSGWPLGKGIPAPGAIKIK
ncbi:hypothetical protein HU200_060617 [Digitaria exilis]|uniref:Probable zinc-ribbon domain-containing protein n=1 Tax=Digitaria exilis TaxID=1010633 RepID=A0A835E087_9POAL|nr:hypothetical protein HU200_060617 [Digitaria exilis]